MEFALNPEADVNGTHLQGEVWIAPSRLVELFGRPGVADEYKVSGEYVFVGGDGSVVTLYDWKSTSLYEGGRSPSAFWASTRPQNFHVGGHDWRVARLFIEWLRARGARLSAAG